MAAGLARRDRGGAAGACAGAVMPFLDWSQLEDSRDLDLIEAAADMMLRHVEDLGRRPPYETKAEDGLRRCEAALGAALQKIHLAQAIYRDKAVEE